MSCTSSGPGCAAGSCPRPRRGELVMPLPVGLVYDAAGHVVLDPDAAVRGALGTCSPRSRRTGSATAVVKAFRAAGLSFPWRHLQRPPQGRDRLAAAAALPPCCGCCTTPATPARSPTAGTASSCCRGRKRGSAHSAPPGMDLLHPRRPPRLHHPRTSGRPTIARLAANAAAHGRDRAAGPPAKAPPCCRASSSAAAAAGG